VSERRILSKKELEAVFETNKSALFSFIFMKTGNHSEAEEVFSKTWVKFLTYARHHAVGLDTVKSFLFRIALNTIRDMARRRKIISFTSLEVFTRKNDRGERTGEYTLPDKGINAFFNLDNKALLARINAVVATFKDPQKEAFHLRFIEEFSFKEIAEIQGTSINTALSRVRYAVEKVKEILSRTGEYPQW